MRQLLERLVWLLVTLLAARTWYTEGFPVPCQVSGSSMAGTLLGAHHEATCDDCGSRFVCEAADAEESLRTTCPNCGALVAPSQPNPRIDGDFVLIDRSAFFFRPPRRWEVIAFRRPGAGSLAVKRVVGLPGERLQIRDGDIYINGQPQRKDLRQQRAVRILVHDAGFRPRVGPTPPPMWQPQVNDSSWRTDDETFAHSPSLGRTAIDWLAFRPWRRDWQAGQAIPAAVTDVYSYNWTRPRREEDVHHVADLMLAVRVVQIGGQGALWLRAGDGRREFWLRLDPAQRRFQCFEDDRPKGTVPFSRPHLPSADKGQGGPRELGQSPAGEGDLPGPLAGATVEVSLFDQQLLFAIDGRVVVQRPFERREGYPPPCLEPLAIGTEGLGVTVGQVKVFRDVYYTLPLLPKAAAELAKGVELGDDRWFVVGDNSPVSEDSRTWPPAQAITSQRLIGRPILVELPFRGVSAGGCYFQVPDPGRIRYIH